MAHPDLLGTGDAAEKCAEGVTVRLGCDLQLRESILAVLALLNAAAERVRDQLLAVADSEYWNARGEQRTINLRAAGVIDATGSARDDHAFTPG
jgi:hypothetical protein